MAAILQKRWLILAISLTALHFLGWLIATLTNAQYDGGDIRALIFWIVLSRVLLIAAGLIILVHLVRWFVTR